MVVCIYGGVSMVGYLWWSVSMVVYLWGSVSMVVFRGDQGDDLWMTSEWHSAAQTRTSRNDGSLSLYLTSRMRIPDGASW